MICKYCRHLFSATCKSIPCLPVKCRNDPSQIGLSHPSQILIQNKVWAIGDSSYTYSEFLTGVCSKCAAILLQHTVEWLPGRWDPQSGAAGCARGSICEQ